VQPTNYSVVLIPPTGGGKLSQVCTDPSACSVSNLPAGEQYMVRVWICSNYIPS
jgi:hypothetical protein